MIVEEVERWKKVDEEAIAGYLADPVAGAVLALVSAELKGSALPALCAKAGEVLTYDGAQASRPSYLGSRAVRAPGCGVGCRGGRLIEIVGDDVDALATEVEKLASWASGMRSAGARWSCSPLPRRKPRHGRSWTPGERETWRVPWPPASRTSNGTDPFAVDASHHRWTLVRQAQALAEEGLGAKDIAKRLRKHEFRVRKALGHAENYTRDELDDAVIRLAALDASLKGASRLAGELELERAIVELVQAPELARH